jgi:PAS domain S-box-containing protein
LATFSSWTPEASDRRSWQRYAVAAGCILAGWIARQALTPAVGPTGLPFIFFFPAVAIAAWYGGLVPGVLAALGSGAAATLSFMEPSRPFQRTFSDAAALIAFLVGCSFIIGAIEAMHRVRRRLARETNDKANVQNLLAATLESIGDGVIVTDPQGKITFLNDEAERLTGWSNTEGAGKPLKEVFRILNGSTRQPCESPVEQVLRSGAVVGLANYTILLAKDGTEVPIDDSAAPIRSGDGPIAGVVLVFRDVTTQRQAEFVRRRLAAIIEFSGDAIVTKDLNGIVQTWNGSAQRMFGYRPEEIVGKPITTIIPPERLNEEAEILADLRSGRPHQRIETVRVAKDGRRIHVSVSVSPLKDAEGRVVGASKILHDVTEIVESREAVARERELLVTTLKSIGDGVLVTDAQNRVTFLNPEAERLTGWTQSEAKGVPLTTVFRIVNEETREEVENPAEKAMRTGSAVGLANHTLLISKNGSETPIDDSAAPILSSDGHVFGVVLVFRDFAERRKTERVVRASEEALREESRRKDEFLAILSHELRNPLAPVRLAVAVLNKIGPPDPELQKLRDIIDRQTLQLTRLLDDLLDVSRISSGKISLRKVAVNIADAVSTAVESIRPLMESRGHVLEVEAPPAAIYVDADPTRLSQIFANLLSNAAKYSNRGDRIKVSIERADSHAVVRVLDHGIGLTSDQMSRIFEMFAQVDGSLERGEGGLGLGLALARTLVELHGGQIEVRSDGLGQGSEFTVRLPALAADQSATPDSDDSVPASKSHRRILVADDNIDSAETLASLLRSAGHEVRTAHEGVSAVETWSAFRPDLAILDIGMPKLNGYDVARQIRFREDAHTVLVAVTGWGQEEDKRRAREAGFDHHLTKPVDPPVIARILALM